MWYLCRECICFSQPIINIFVLCISECCWKGVHKGGDLTPVLTHWGRVTHIGVSILTIIVSNNGLSPGLRQAITWTNAGILSIGTLGTNFREILIKILAFSFKNMRLKVSSGKWRPFCFGPNVLKCSIIGLQYVKYRISRGEYRCAMLTCKLRI